MKITNFLYIMMISYKNNNIIFIIKYNMLNTILLDKDTYIYFNPFLKIYKNEVIKQIINSSKKSMILNKLKNVYSFNHVFSLDLTNEWLNAIKNQNPLKYHLLKYHFEREFNFFEYGDEIIGLYTLNGMRWWTIQEKNEFIRLFKLINLDQKNGKT